MVHRPLLKVTAALAALLHLNLTPAALAAPMLVEGRVIIVSGNQLPGPRTPKPSPGRQRIVVAMAGTVSPLQPGLPFLPASALRAPILSRTRCNDQGVFRLVLPRSAASSSASERQLTLLLQVPGGYYLNHFDGQGHFAAISIPMTADQPPIVLRDDRGALY